MLPLASFNTARNFIPTFQKCIYHAAAVVPFHDFILKAMILFSRTYIGTDHITFNSINTFYSINPSQRSPLAGSWSSYTVY